MEQISRRKSSLAVQGGLGMGRRKSTMGTFADFTRRNTVAIQQNKLERMCELCTFETSKHKVEARVLKCRIKKFRINQIKFHHFCNVIKNHKRILINLPRQTFYCNYGFFSKKLPIFFKLPVRPRKSKIRVSENPAPKVLNSQPYAKF